LRLRGPNGARDEFHLAAAAQNLRKLAKLIPMPTLRPACEASGFHASWSPSRQPLSAADFFNGIRPTRPDRLIKGCLKAAILVDSGKRTGLDSTRRRPSA
jgi:hypothetical protein